MLVSHVIALQILPCVHVRIFCIVCPNKLWSALTAGPQTGPNCLQTRLCQAQKKLIFSDITEKLVQPQQTHSVKIIFDQLIDGDMFAFTDSDNHRLKILEFHTRYHLYTQQHTH